MIYQTFGIALLAFLIAGCADRDINVRNDTSTVYDVGIELGDAHKYDVVKLLPGHDMVVRDGAHSLRAILLTKNGVPQVRCAGEHFASAITQDKVSRSRKIVSISKCVRMNSL